MRGPMRSPGRPWKARREDRVRFWEGIAGGVSSEDAAAGAGVSVSVGRYLSFAEREEIAIFCAQGVGVREIGRRLGRCASTISRELRRNASTRSRGVVYRATTAQWHAQRRASRPKLSKLAANDELRTTWRIVWVVRSPAQMVSWCQDPRCAGRVAVTEGELTGGGQRLGVLSRSRGGSGSISPTMSPCESPMKPSTRRPMCKAEAR